MTFVYFPSEFEEAIFEASHLLGIDRRKGKIGVGDILIIQRSSPITSLELHRNFHFFRGSEELKHENSIGTYERDINLGKFEIVESKLSKLSDVLQTQIFNDPKLYSEEFILYNRNPHHVNLVVNSHSKEGANKIYFFNTGFDVPKDRLPYNLREERDLGSLVGGRENIVSTITEAFRWTAQNYIDSLKKK